MTRKRSATRAKASKLIPDLAPTKVEQIKAGRVDRNLNTSGPNPIVISRDRALGNG